MFNADPKAFIGLTMAFWLASINGRGLRSETRSANLAHDIQRLGMDVYIVYRRPGFQFAIVNIYNLRRLSSIRHFLIDDREVFPG